MANIANGSVEVISADKTLKEDIKRRIKDTPSFHFDGEAYMEIGDASIICAFTGKNSVIDAWDFLSYYHKTMIMNIKAPCTIGNLVMVTKLGQRGQSSYQPRIQM